MLTLLAITFALATPTKEPPPPQVATLPTSPICQTPSHFFISTSLLLWQTKLWGLQFATKSFLPNTPGTSQQTFEEKLFVPDFAWQPGFKILLGGKLPYDGWDLSINWLYYHEQLTLLKRAFESVTSPAGIGIIPLWQAPFLELVAGNTASPLRYSFASDNWKMVFNSIDFDLGRSFLPESSLPMRLSIGAKLSSIRQKYQVHYDGGTTALALSPQGSTPSSFTFLSSSFLNTTRQWGLGPRIALQSKWSMLWGFHLIGNGAFSTLCSFFHSHSQYNDIIQPIGPCTSNLKEHFIELTPVCEAMLGLNWGMCCTSRCHLDVSLGYEWQYWWSINHIRRNFAQTLPGDTWDSRGEMQMQGLNAAVRVDF